MVINLHFTSEIFSKSFEKKNNFLMEHQESRYFRVVERYGKYFFINVLCLVLITSTKYLLSFPLSSADCTEEWFTKEINGCRIEQKLIHFYHRILCKTCYSDKMNFSSSARTIKVYWISWWYEGTPIERLPLNMLSSKWILTGFCTIGILSGAVTKRIILSLVKWIFQATVSPKIISTVQSCCEIFIEIFCCRFCFICHLSWIQNITLKYSAESASIVYISLPIRYFDTSVCICVNRNWPDNTFSI